MHFLDFHAIDEDPKKVVLQTKREMENDVVYSVNQGKWTDDKGMERYSTEIQCTDFTFLTNKNEQQGAPTVSSTNTQNQVSSEQKSIVEDENDDLPF